MTDTVISAFKTGEYVSAALLFEARIMEQRQALGDFSVEVLSTMERLVICYSNIEQHDKASKLNEERFERMQLFYGELHPLTLKALHNLARYYATLSDFRKALALCEVCHKKRLTVLGGANEDTIRSRDILSEFKFGIAIEKNIKSGANPLNYWPQICFLGFTGLFRDFILKDENTRNVIKTSTFRSAAFKSMDVSGDTDRIAALNFGPELDGFTALMFASLGGHVSIARLLIDIGADVNARIAGAGAEGWALRKWDGHDGVGTNKKIGHTVLIIACAKRGNADVARLLIESGADVNAKSASIGFSALSCSAAAEDIDTARVLIEHGADINAEDNSGASALRICSERHCLDFVKLLVVSGASVLPTTRKTALENVKNVEVVKYLDSLVLCDHCLRTSSNMKRCKGCSTAKYCSRECQASDWKVRHKALCKLGVGDSLKLYNPNPNPSPSPNFNSNANLTDKQSYAYSCIDFNLLASNKNEVLRKVLDYLDVVQYYEYKHAFVSSGLDAAKLRDLCSSGARFSSCLMDSFLSEVIGVTDANHKGMISSTLQSLNSKTCLHLCIEKWDGQYVCNQCYKYLNYDDGREESKGHCDNLRDSARESREREIEASITPDAIPPELIDEERRKDFVGMLSQGRGISIGWLVDFTIKNDCWDMTTQEVCRKFIFPATAAARRCRYVELDHMQGITGCATTFISHCRGGTWGDLVAAVCDGDADRKRQVWIDIFACRQWPSSRPDLDFQYTIRHCSSFLVVCSSLKEVADLDFYEITIGNINALPKKIRDKIAFLRVWCLVEIYSASQCLDMPIIMRGGSYKRINKDKFEFEHNREMLRKMCMLVDISKAEATVTKDKEDILNLITDNGKDADGIKKLNIKVRGTIMCSFSKSGKIGAGIVENAVCGDKKSLAIVVADPLNYWFDICSGGFTRLLRDYILKDERMMREIKSRSTSDGVTALMCACQGGHLEIATLLINIGADINAKTFSNEGITALGHACLAGHVDIARFLIKSGAYFNTKQTSSSEISELMMACERGYADIARLLIDSGVDVNLRATSLGTTALMAACGGGSVETARLLIDRGADVNAKRTADGSSVLMITCTGGHLDTARLLIDRGANINTEDEDKMTAIMAACGEGHFDTVKLLVERGASVAPILRHFTEYSEKMRAGQGGGHRKVVKYLESLVLCDHCLKTSLDMEMCKGCSTAKYCSRECQASDWKVRHKALCKPRYKI